jgi:hypothetical protein
MATYAPDGSWNITVVDGTLRVNDKAPDGSFNVVNDPGTRVPARHACGAQYVKKVTTGIVPRRNPTGALNVALTPYVATGAQRVTVVAGVLT